MRRQTKHWTHEEHAIIEFCRKRGDSWASIAARLPGRIPTDCQQYWQRQTVINPVYKIDR